jgi:ketosteroid isomerase-like protein
VAQENVDVVRTAVDAYNRGDLEALLGLTAPAFELDLSRAAGPMHGVYARTEVAAFWTEVRDSWESVRLEPHEFIEVGPHVVVPWTMHFSGRDGIEVQARVTWVWTFHGQAIERLTMYQDRQDALEALGASA